jgi:PAS domain S-box-containing protein
MFAAALLIGKRRLLESDRRMKMLLWGYLLLAIVLTLTVLNVPTILQSFEGIIVNTFTQVGGILAMLLLSGALILLGRRSQAFDRHIHRWLMFSTSAALGAIVVFSVQNGDQGYDFLVSHIFVILSVHVLYRAVMETGVRRPSDLLFRDLQRSEQRFRDLTLSIGDWIYETDADFRVTYCSDRVRDILGFEPEEIVGHTPLDFVASPNQTLIKRWMRQIIRHPEPYRNIESWSIRKDGRLLYFTTSGVPIFDLEGTLTGFRGVNQDITTRKRAEERIQAALAEKEVLLRELHHRVKNNLNALVALVEMQVNEIDDPLSARILLELQGRIQTMALVHENLNWSDNLARIGMREYLTALVDHLLYAWGKTTPVRFQVMADDIELPVDVVIPCGLIVNELVTNALKHAFPPEVLGGRRESPFLQVSLRRDHEKVILCVRDNGVGLPMNYDWRASTSLGLKLVHILATQQLDGQVELDTTQGMAFCVTFDLA